MKELGGLHRRCTRRGADGLLLLGAALRLPRWCGGGLPRLRLLLACL